jgi:cbb3-type cytochrome oxidase subunit 3
MTMTRKHRIIWAILFIIVALGVVWYILQATGSHPGG